MSRFTDYAAAAATGIVALDWQTDLVTPDGEVLATTALDPIAPTIRWGAVLQPLAHDLGLFSARSATLAVIVDNDDLIPGEAGDLLDPLTGNSVRIAAGLLGQTLYQLATLRIIKAETTRSDRGDRTVTLALAEQLWALDTELGSGFAWDEADGVSDTVARLLGRVIPTSSFTITEIPGCDLAPGAVEAGENVRDLAEEILAGCGWELAADETGHIFSRPVSPVTLDPYSEVWEYGAGAIPIENPTKIRDGHAPQAYRVTYGSSTDTDTGQSLMVYDRDPRSLGYFAGEGEIKIEPVRFPWIRHNAQAYEGAYGRMRRDSPGPGLVTFDSIPNPAMRNGDQIMITADDIKASGMARALSVNLPTQVDGQMRVVARYVWDPETYASTPTRRGASWQTSFADDFDRADENLEQDPDGSGSAEWAEFGVSFGIEGRRCVQRVAGRWCVAVVNTPIKTLDHKATCTDIRIPAGTRWGPGVRSTGVDDGYAAIADSTGTITLEYWQAGQAVATLGSHSAGGSIDGSDLAAVAVGSTISVELDGAEVISVSDDRGIGPHATIVALGGNRPDYPSSGPYSVAVAT